jgi:hypothetical protein
MPPPSHMMARVLPQTHSPPPAMVRFFCPMAQRRRPTAQREPRMVPAPRPMEVMAKSIVQKPRSIQASLTQAVWPSQLRPFTSVRVPPAVRSWKQSQCRALPGRCLCLRRIRRRTLRHRSVLPVDRVDARDRCCGRLRFSNSCGGQQRRAIRDGGFEFCEHRQLQQPLRSRLRVPSVHLLPACSSGG